MREVPAKVPFVDLTATAVEVRVDLADAVTRVLDSGRFVLGPELEAFERAFAECTGTSCAVGVGSGTDALHLALRALDIGPGDEVITPAHTFIATALAITMAGAKPVFVDVGPDDLLIDPQAITVALSTRTKAIVPVHLYGRCADMDAICVIARANDLAVIEDASQAHGARIGTRPAGSIGDIGCFSFYPTKNLGALGDGGALVTSDEAVAARARALRNYAQSQPYRHETLGFNSRLDELQAALLSAKLPHLAEWNRVRRELARRYDELLRDSPLSTPSWDGRESHVFHLYVVRSSLRDELRSYLDACGIQTQIHYPIPIHQQPAYAEYAAIELPVTELAAEEVLSLPMFPGLTDLQQDQVCRAIEAFYGQG